MENAFLESGIQPDAFGCMKVFLRFRDAVLRVAGWNGMQILRFSLRFKHFSGSGKLFKIFLQRCACINASRASWELIFYTLKSCDRWLFSAYRFVAQFAILRRNGAERNGTFNCNFIIVPKLQKSVPKMTFRGPINVAIIYYRHNRQNWFPINSDHH